MKTNRLIQVCRLSQTVLNPILSLALIVGVIVALWQLGEVAHQTKLQSDTLRLTQQLESAKLVFQFRDRIESARFTKLVSDIQNHDQNYALLVRADGGKGGSFRQIDIEGYLGNFEDMGYLVRDNLIFSQMAYNNFSYDIEKAWCNADVQRVIREARKADKSATAASDPIYGNFEKLALAYLAREKQTCKDLANQ